MRKIITQMSESIPDNTLEMMIQIFLNNLKVASIIIVSGLLFSIFSLMILFSNGIIIGFMFSIVPAPLMLLYIVPHGIFEIPQLLISIVCAILVTRLEINLIKGVLQRDKTFKGELQNSSQIIMDIILSVSLIIVLLLIAAFVEAYITPGLANNLSTYFNLSMPSGVL